MRIQPTSIRFLICTAALLATGALRVTLATTALGQDVDSRVVNREYYLKAAFLYQFTNFIDWPEGELANGSLEIAVLGQDPFGKALQTIDGKVVQGRTVVIKRSHDSTELQSCDVLFIARSEQSRIGKILSEMDGRSVLTVSEIDGFAQQGGMINFTASGNRIRFEINAAAAKRARLRVSSRLMRVATVVNETQAITTPQ